MISKGKNIILLFLLSYSLLFGQDSPYKAVSLTFIDLNKNKIDFCGNSYSYFVRIFDKLNVLTIKGEGKIKVLHIGDSHIQADYFSDRLRDNFQNIAPGIKGSRGFLFPYNIAKTNNPENFKVRFSGSWLNCKNIQQNNNCVLGISGITVYTYDTNSKIELIPVKKINEISGFNKVKILHSLGDSIFDYKLVSNDTINGIVYPEGYTMFDLKNYFDTLHLILSRLDTIQKMADVRGIELESDDHGVVYSSVGVNGAKVSSFLKCSLFDNDLKILEPDYIIISLGTNDVYSSKFDVTLFEEKFYTLIKKIRTTLPKAAILITTPPDSYRKRKFPNPDLPKVVSTIYKIGELFDCAVWDLYNIMGGYCSIKVWYKNGLASSDKVHFTKGGYYIQGDLLYNSFLATYDNYLSKKINRNGVY